MLTFDQIASEIQSLTIEQRKRLIAVIVDSLTADSSRKTHRLAELEGLGAELWQGVDAQKYVDELRQEWDHRP